MFEDKLTIAGVPQCRSGPPELAELSITNVDNRVSELFTLSTHFWMHWVIEVLIEQTQRHKGREKAMKSETERCNQLTKFALVVSQNTFLKGKGGWVVGGGSVLHLIHSLKSHCRVLHSY